MQLNIKLQIQLLAGTPCLLDIPLLIYFASCTKPELHDAKNRDFVIHKCCCRKIPENIKSVFIDFV